VRNLLGGAGIDGAVATGAAAVIGALSLLRRSTFAFSMLVVPALVAGAVIVILGQPMRPRFFFFIAGAAAIFAGRGAGLIAQFAARQPRQLTLTLVSVTLLLIALSAPGLPRNYSVPKQDFDGAVRYLDGRMHDGVVVSAAGAACWPIENYYRRTDWPCVHSVDDLSRLLRAPEPVLVVYTLGEYIEDAQLRDRLRGACREIRRFPGTLGGGDMIVCDPRATMVAP